MEVIEFDCIAQNEGEKIRCLFILVTSRWLTMGTIVIILVAPFKEYRDALFEQFCKNTEGSVTQRQLSRRHHLLLTLPLQQEVATEAALTLVADAVVLAVHTHGVLLCGPLGHPFLNLFEKQRQRSAPQTQQWEQKGW